MLYDIFEAEIIAFFSISNADNRNDLLTISLMLIVGLVLCIHAKLTFKAGRFHPIFYTIVFSHSNWVSLLFTVDCLKPSAFIFVTTLIDFRYLSQEDNIIIVRTAGNKKILSEYRVLFFRGFVLRICSFEMFYIALKLYFNYICIYSRLYFFSYIAWP